MRFTLVPSSYLYPLNPNDLIGLVDADIMLQENFKQDGVAILLGNRKKGIPDKLLFGRTEIEALVQKGELQIPVRVYFQVPLGIAPFLGLFKYFRKRQKCMSMGCYHLNPSFLREEGLERCFRTAENAYVLARYKTTEEERIKKYHQLSESLKNGFDDACPLTVMLHRKKRKIDTVDDGHHRLNLCIEHRLKQVAIQFSYASSLVACKNILLWRNIFASR